MTQVDREQLKQLLTRGWMTHDAMWFAAVAEELGMATANRLNKTAIRRMAAIEVKRLRQALGIDQVTTLGELRDFLEGAFDLVIGDFMEAELRWQADGLKVAVPECFAHKGIARLGVLDQYECGIFERIFAWLDVLGLRYEVHPTISGCLAAAGRTCAIELRLSLPAEA